jgi:thiamine-phosphate pyrophosphorylase
MRFPSGLYVITPDWSDTGKLVEKVGQAIGGGAAAVQYRNKGAKGQLAATQALTLLRLCREAGVPLIINDDVGLAQRIGADGVHLGKRDVGVFAARRTLGRERIIGASCYQDIELARRAQIDGADYVAFGSFYPSPTKPDAEPAPVQLLALAAAELTLPIVAIGGIAPDSALPLLEAGADAVAVSSALFDAADTGQAARRFSSLFRVESEQ